MRKLLKKRLPGAVRGVLVVAAAAAVLYIFFTGLAGVRRGSDGEGKKQLEESIRRTAVACYATEGIYPPTVEYMQEHYGLQVDGDKYFVDYQIFASNLMPTFTVLELGG